MSGLELYLLLCVVPKLAVLSAIISVLGLVVSCISGIAVLVTSCECSSYDVENETSDYKTYLAAKTTLKYVVAVTAVALAIGAVTPDRDTIYTIYIAKYVTNNEQLKQLPDYLVKYVKQQLKDTEHE